MAFVPLNNEHVETLKVSKNLVGPLQSIVVDADTGEILLGKHREKADPTWPRVKVQVKDAKQRLLIKLCGNIQRTIPMEETRYFLVQLARILESEGTPKDHVCSEIVKIVPYSSQYVEHLLPKEYLMLSKARPKPSVNLSNKFDKTLSSVPSFAQSDIVSNLTSVAKNLVDSGSGALNYPFQNCRCRECDHKGDCY